MSCKKIILITTILTYVSSLPTYAQSVMTSPSGGPNQVQATTSAPSYTNNTTANLSATTSGGVRVQLNFGSTDLALVNSAIPVNTTNAGSVNAGTAASFSGLTGGVFNSSAPTLTNGQQAATQMDSSGNILAKVNVALPTGTNSLGTVGLNAGTNLIGSTGPTTATSGNGGNQTQFTSTTITSASTYQQVVAAGSCTHGGAIWDTSATSVTALLYVDFTGATTGGTSLRAGSWPISSPQVSGGTGGIVIIPPTSNAIEVFSSSTSATYGGFCS